MKAYVGVFLTRTGTGTQTISGIVDRDGAAFVPSLIFFQSGNNYFLNAINYQESLDNAYADDRGADDGTKHFGYAMADIGRSGFRTIAHGVGQGFSLLDYQADTFFAGNFQQRAVVAAIRLGEFDLSFATNHRTGYVMFVALGGDDLTTTYSPTLLQNGLISTAADPQAVFNIYSGQLMTTGTGSSTAAGSLTLGYGWEANGSNRGCTSYRMDGQSGEGNWGGVLTSRMAARIDTSGNYDDTLAPIVSAWGASDVTIGGTASALGATPFIFCGSGIKATAGSFTQPTSPGIQTIDLGINAKWVVLSTQGGVASSTPTVGLMSNSVGWTDGVRQSCFWCGESADGIQIPLNGARFISNSSLVRAAVASGASTTFDAVAEFVSIGSDGLLRINWTSVDSTPRQVIWFALGEALAPPPSIGVLLTQLPIEVAYPYQVVSPLTIADGLNWVTPPPTRSRRGR